MSINTYEPCELCHTRELTFDHEGHTVCPYCVFTACGKCWAAKLQMKRGWIHLRWKCPNCGWKSKPLR